MQATLHCSWGFDGSSGQSQYKQKYKEDNAEHNDQSLFATTVIPLRLIAADGETILWNNNTPQSTRYCRPLKLQFVGEDTEVVLGEKEDVQSEIDLLSNFAGYSAMNEIDIVYSLHLTLIDGKVLNILTGTKSTQRCPICQALPSTFNNLGNIDTDVFMPEPSAMQHGISPLHAWIRFFECCLHISYKLGTRRWQAKDPKDKILVAERKKIVQVY